MCTIVEASLPADRFVLHQTLSRHPSAEFEILQLVANGADRPMPFVWASGDGTGRLPGAIENDPSIKDAEIISRLEDEYLMRLEWATDIQILLFVLLEKDATVLEATGKNGRWRFRLLFLDHGRLSATREYCEEHGIELDFKRIYQLSGSFRRGQYGLSERQYETITRAYREGYYEVPRGVSLQTLAADLDVSHQALSERVRRGLATLIENTLQPELHAAPTP